MTALRPALRLYDPGDSSPDPSPWLTGLLVAGAATAHVLWAMGHETPASVVILVTAVVAGVRLFATGDGR